MSTDRTSARFGSGLRSVHAATLSGVSAARSQYCDCVVILNQTDMNSKVLMQALGLLGNMSANLIAMLATCNAQCAAPRSATVVGAMELGGTASTMAAILGQMQLPSYSGT